ncbi:MAG: IS66 family transposase [Verrucomicrobiales bacterium]|nr:IS66 family transposase [Verrucomicrobiales bacterium]
MPAPESLPQPPDARDGRIEELERMDRAHREQKKRDDERIQKLERDLAEVRRRLDQLLRMHYGRTKGEQISREQLELMLVGLPAVLEEPVAAAPAPKPAVPARPRHPRRALDDEHLHTRETVIEPVEVSADPQGWTRLGEERTSQLDFEPGKLFRHVVVRPRYVRREQFAIAPLPAQPIDKGMVGAGLLAWLLINKFVDHVPLYRTEAIRRRQYGVDVPRNTLAGWVEQSTELLGPIYRAMLAKLRKRTYLQVDETPTRYLDPEVRGKSALGYLWVYLDPGGEVLFQWSTGRAHDAPKEFLGDYQGILQVDGYGAYEALVRARGGALSLAHCWAHARREIKEALAGAARTGAWLLGQIQAMYEIERGLREAKAGPALREAVRSSQTRMVVDRLFKAMIRLRARELPGNAMAKALDYCLERREGLSRFLGDGRIEVDSNLCYAEMPVMPRRVVEGC